MKIVSFKFITLLSLLLISWLGLFFDNLVQMETVWRNSNTFTHGYFILPIVLWLIWRDKAYLLNSHTKVSWLALPVILGCLAVALFSYAADINVLGQLAAVGCLVGILWLLLGNQITWHYKFPIAFLFFLVPMGENLIPDLQDITAWFTVLYLKLIGIPVFRDGLYIQIPAGMFEVAVACSGIRFLISSVVIGTLYAYLSYRSFKKQLLFALFSFVLPIFANGLRAFLIVLIAHLTDMEYATGADHLIYGWVFFGFVIMVMFWVGAKFADPELTDEQLKTKAQQQQVKTYSYVPVAVATMLVISTIAMKQQMTIVETPKVPAPSLSGNEITDSDWGILFRQSLRHSLVSPKTTGQYKTEFFRAVYANKQSAGELISSSNRLFDGEQWTIVGNNVITVNEGIAKIVHLRNISGFPKSFIYQYKVGEVTQISAPKTKLQQAWNGMTGQNGLGEVRAVSIDGNADLADAQNRLVKLLQYMEGMEQ